MYDSVFTKSPIYRVLENLGKTEKSFKLAEARLINDDQVVENFGTELRKAIGRSSTPFSVRLGTHPEFMNLKNNESRISSVVSVFIDIKGSTQLYNKYSYEEAFDMSHAIIESALHIIQAFDGHVVRLHGDGIFVIFKKTTSKIENSIIDAINSTSTLLWFLENFLNDKFKANNLDPLKIRVGIDLDGKALWKHSGIEGCSELSPNGYHVSLAAKLQSEARVNSIMIGDNIKEALQLPEEFISIKTFVDSGVEKKDTHIHGDYRMWQFNWDKHIEKFTWIPKTTTGSMLPAVSTSPFSIQASVSNEQGETKKILSSMEVLDKGLSLKFTVGPVPQNCSIQWYIENRGMEAEEADNEDVNNNKLFFEITEARNKTIASGIMTEYWGHHYLICKVTYPNLGKTVTQKFGVFVGKNEIAQIEHRTQNYRTIEVAARRV
jgi:adenylate cyclase